jgi:hypothetical protein
MPHPVPLVLAAKKAIAVLRLTNNDLVGTAYDLVKDGAVQSARIFFLSGGPFAHIHKTSGADVLHEMLHFIEGLPVMHPVLRRFHERRMGFSDFKVWLADQPSSYIDDVDWSAVVSLYNRYGQGLHTVVRRLSGCGRSIPGFARVTMATIHKAKGLSWPYVLLLDTPFQTKFQRNMADTAAAEAARDPNGAGGAGVYDSPRALHRLFANRDPALATRAINLVYVAMTRAEEHLYLPEAMAAWLQPAAGGLQL